MPYDALAQRYYGSSVVVRRLAIFAQLGLDHDRFGNADENLPARGDQRKVELRQFGSAAGHYANSYGTPERLRTRLEFDPAKTAINLALTFIEGNRRHAGE